VDPQVESGKLWVAAKIDELAHARKLPVDAFEWEDPHQRSWDDFTPGTIGLAIWSGAERKATRMARTDLEAVERWTEVQGKLTWQLAELLVELK
jgi:hypothetical protein